MPRKKSASRRQGWPGGREMAGTGSEQPLNSTGKRHPAAACGAKCSADSDSEFDLLARAVLLVAGMAIPEHDRAAVLARVLAVQSAAREGS
jgi:hypothetical protein